IGAYATYIGNLHRNTYAAYIRLQELEKVWGLWEYCSPTKTMPFDPVASQAPSTPAQLKPVPGPMYRLTPALSSFEITLRLLLDFMDVNIPGADDSSAKRFRIHRPYVNHASRVDALMRNLSAQLLMMRTVIDMDLANAGDSDVKVLYDLVHETSKESLALEGHWFWRDAAPNASFPPHQLLQRISGLVQCHFAGLPFGPGLSNIHGLHLPYDKLVLPAFTRQHCCQDEDDGVYAEDHFFATVHQITEAWCCVMERQLDVAQFELDNLNLTPKTKDEDGANVQTLNRVARRYRFCCQIWEYLIDHISILSEMDSADYLTLKLHLHGASGGQSVRLRQLGRRIANLMPLVPKCFEAYVGKQTSNDPTSLVDMLHVLSQVRSEKTENESAAPELIATLESMFSCHTAPGAQCIQIVQAIQMLENAVRRFYFGHQHLAIMVLGAGAAGTQELTVKMLERGWKDANRYLSCEHAKEHLSSHLDAEQLTKDKSFKGRIIKTLSDDARARHQKIKMQPQWQTMMCPNTHMTVELSSISKHEEDKELHTSEFRPYFERSLALQDPQTLHFSTYGMGLAPDVSFESVMSTHRMLTSTLNESWNIVFGKDFPKAQKNILNSLGLGSDKYNVNFGSNCHEFLLRLLSCKKSSQPLKVLTSDAEFLSFTRQMQSLSCECAMEQVPLEPFNTYGARFAAKVKSSDYDVVYASIVYSNYQFRLPDSDIIQIASATTSSTLFILDVAQTLENVPLALPSSYSNLCVVGSGIKHATAGPGLGFIAFPSHQQWAPVNTGWIADLSVLSPTYTPSKTISYTPELAFQGGTPGFHYSLRQFNDVQEFYKSHGWSIQKRHEYVLSLQTLFFHRLGRTFTFGATNRANQDPSTISNAFVLKHSAAPYFQEYLTNPSVRPITTSSQLIFHCDVRKKTHLRFGFGLHHVKSEVLALADILVEANEALQTRELFCLVV
ncbi:hypothetical protein THRCLA_05875, partial [Thraustotheca clavata]